MHAISVTGLSLLAGTCAYATVNHLSAGLTSCRAHRAHLLFAGICLTMTGFALSLGLAYRAETVADYAMTLKWNVAFVLGSFMLYPWFCAEFCGVRPPAWLRVSTAVFALLLILNPFQAYSLQYAAITRLDTLTLPWGETIAQPVGHNTVFFWIASGLAIATIGYAVYALALAWRRDREATTLAMLVANLLFVAAASQGILVRAGLVQFIHLGPYSQVLMVLAMSVALTQHTRRRLLDSEQRFRSLVEQSPFSIQVLAPDGSTRQVNPAWERLWGAKADALAGYNILQDGQLMAKGVMPHIQQGFAGTPAELPPIVYNPAENPTPGPFNDRWVRAHIYPIKDEAGLVHDVILMHEDVTERKWVEDAIRLIAAGVTGATGEAFFQQLTLNLAKVLGVDGAYVGVLDARDGQRLDPLALCRRGRIASAGGLPLAGSASARVIAEGSCACPREARRQFPADRLLAEMAAEAYIGLPLRDVEGRVMGVIAVVHGKPLQETEEAHEILDIFAARGAAELQRQRAEAHVRRMAYQDYLTGLANRAQVHQWLEDMLAGPAGDAVSGALLLIDLDHFKTINDAVGHDVGDEVLRVVAARLIEAVGQDARAARLGGDEFVVIRAMARRSAPEAELVAFDLAQDILKALGNPVLVGERAFNVGASIGVVLFPQQGETSVRDILRQADLALYRAKGRGRGHCQLYAADMQATADRRLLLEAGLRHALAEGGLTLHYQPQFDAAGRMLGSEALLRWHHPEQGEIPPASFIPVAEETGLIHALGARVFDLGCTQLGTWLRSGVPFQGHLSINVSPWQFSRPDLVDEVRGMLSLHGIEPHRLMLELTESALLYDLEEAIAKLHALRGLGLKIALDDFGTGYSSLAYLRDLPLDQIKIDKTFVAELMGSSRSPLVESIIAIGKHLKLPVLAEGVEVQAQHARLLELGCEGFQGFLFCRPLPAGEFLGWLCAQEDA